MDIQIEHVTKSNARRLLQVVGSTEMEMIHFAYDYYYDHLNRK